MLDEEVFLLVDYPWLLSPYFKQGLLESESKMLQEIYKNKSV